ncbi:MAG: shikimate kinase [Pirellulaceae bacterium]
MHPNLFTSMNLYFIGLRGAGKSTVGFAVSRLLKRPYFDSDQQIIEQSHQSIAEIFANDGEAEFRRWEQLMCEVLTQQRNVVVSWGGGIVTNSENRKNLQRTGKSIWLTASPEFLAQRIGADQSSAAMRPRLTNENDLVAELRSTLEKRRDLYAACADYTLDVENRSLEDLVTNAVSWWQESDNH